MALLKRSLDYKRTKKAWYLPIILLMPGVTVLTYALMRLLGLPLSAPPFAVVVGLAMFVAFFVAALGEELGWSGYAIDPMQARWNALGASILLGLMWAVWHWVTLLQAHRFPGGCLSNLAVFLSLCCDVSNCPGPGANTLPGDHY